jgi:hypothetical protein
VNEQRKSRRFDLLLPLELLRNGSRKLLENCETKNLSSSGVLFRSGAALQLGDVLEYVITLPSPSQNMAVKLKCKGKVVRRLTGEAAATLDRWEFVRDAPPRPL